MPTTTVIDATYRVVTPLFCAGAGPEYPELRLSSFKGVLRFWWRALAWSLHNGDLKVIRREEDALFGSAKGGQSRVAMRLVPGSELKMTPVNKVLNVPGMNQVVGEGARYLGYGVMEAYPSGIKNTRAGQLIRGCLNAPFDFTVQMRCRDKAQFKAQLESLKEATITLGMLGGMGSRSRKGYGSLVLQSLEQDGESQWSAPQSMNDLRDKIAAQQRTRSAATFPEFTALSNETRYVLLSSSSKKEPVELLDLVGREMVRFRSWGRKGKILGDKEDSEKQFEDDHDMMKDVMSSKPAKTHPRRIAFGLPHNYGQKKNQQVNPFNGKNNKHLDRRASPLFIHIHECGGTSVAVLSFLPARFLPEGRNAISVGGTKVPQAPEQELYRPIHQFLDRLLDPKQRKEPFTEAVEVPS